MVWKLFHVPPPPPVKERSALEKVINPAPLSPRCTSLVMPFPGSDESLTRMVALLAGLEGSPWAALVLPPGSSTTPALVALGKMRTLTTGTWTPPYWLPWNWAPTAGSTDQGSFSLRAVSSMTIDASPPLTAKFWVLVRYSLAPRVMNQ